MSFLGPSWKGLIHLSWVLTLINQAWQKSFPPRKKMFETFMKQKSRIFYLGHPISSAFFCCWPHHQLWPACSSTPRCLEAVYLWKSDDRYLPLKAISSMAGRCSSWCYRCMLACQCAFIGGQHFIIIVQWHLEDGKQSITYGFWLMTNRPFSARADEPSLHSSPTAVVHICTWSCEGWPWSSISIREQNCNIIIKAEREQYLFSLI